MLAISCTLAHICIRVSIIASRTYVFLEAFLSTKLSQKRNDSCCRPRKIPHPPVVSYAVQYETQPSVLRATRLRRSPACVCLVRPTYHIWHHDRYDQNRCCLYTMTADDPALCFTPLSHPAVCTCTSSHLDQISRMDCTRCYLALFRWKKLIWWDRSVLFNLGFCALQHERFG